jgi:membrane-associated phospholipid phosphatase
MRGKFLFAIFKRCEVFLYPYFLLVIFSLAMLVIFGKATTHIWSDQHHLPFLDSWFYYYTYVGDGTFVIILALLLLLYKVLYSIYIATSYAISSLVSTILKHILDTSRPMKFFQGTDYELHYVKGVNVYLDYSFPSGHSASAFALFLTLSMLTAYKGFRVLFLFLAVLVAYSRIYLSQHFLIDTIGGSAIGVITVFFCSYLYQNLHGEWLEKPIYKSPLFKKLSL